jgi:hypothetical protein
MIDLHWGQSEVFEDLMVKQACRYSVVDCSRGWGKSYLAGVTASTAVFELLELPASVPNKVVYIVAPTYDQVTDIYYPLLNFDLGLENYVIRPASRDLGRFHFEKNVELRLVSYESVERMRGKGAYLTVWDEVSSCHKGITAKEAWDSVIKPCINTRWSPKRAKIYGARSPGRALFIGTPKGYNFFHELYTYQERDPQWKSYKYSYLDSPLLDPDEIERSRELMDPITFASEYLADFKESGSSVFYCFDRSLHVRNDLPYFQKAESGEEFGEDVHLAIDFNVGLQCTSAFAVRGNQQHFLKEFKGHPDTETLAQVLKETFKGHRLFAYPDPSGKARKASAPVGRTDFTILQSAGITCLSRAKAPPIVDSVQAVNRRLKNANGKTSMFFSTNVPGTIASMEKTKWVDNNPDIAVIDKSEGVEHFSDGVRYCTEFLYPVVLSTKTVSRGFNF